VLSYACCVRGIIGYDEASIRPHVLADDSLRFPKALNRSLGQPCACAHAACAMP
jgi:hypothetical protein